MPPRVRLLGDPVRFPTHADHAIDPFARRRFADAPVAFLVLAPSSPIAPSTAMRRPAAGICASVESAAHTESGLAL